MSVLSLTYVYETRQSVLIKPEVNQNVKSISMQKKKSLNLLNVNPRLSTRWTTIRRSKINKSYNLNLYIYIYIYIYIYTYIICVMLVL